MFTTSSFKKLKLFRIRSYKSRPPLNISTVHNVVHIDPKEKGKGLEDGDAIPVDRPSAGTTPD